MKKKRINVELDFCGETCYAYADKDSITRVITNLLDNAVKFTNDGGKIQVTVTQKQQEVIVSVLNTGCGISESDLSMIFKRFYKADKSRSGNKSGTGIGLYLVKNILLAHGSDISAESVENEYAKFSFKLNRGKSHQMRVKF